MLQNQNIITRCTKAKYVLLGALLGLGYVANAMFLLAAQVIARLNAYDVGCKKALATNTTLNPTNPYDPVNGAGIYLAEVLFTFPNLIALMALYVGMAKLTKEKFKALAYLTVGMSLLVDVGLTLLTRPAVAMAHKHEGFGQCAADPHNILPYATTSQNTENLLIGLSSSSSIVTSLIAARSGWLSRKYGKDVCKLPKITEFFNCPKAPINRIEEEGAYQPLQGQHAITLPRYSATS